MKTPLLALAIGIATFLAPLTPAPLIANEAERTNKIDETSQFIFLSVLEGLYEDGLTNDDVAQILMRRENESYFHFIYACPVCNATIWAMEAYQSRPKAFYGLKLGGSTFGSGLSKEMHAQLYSKEPAQRLTAVHILVKSWIERRMKHLRPSADEQKALVKQLELKREEGMRMLESFRKKEHGETFGVSQAAPAYADFTECAVCNAAAGRPMKLPEQPPKSGK